MIVLYVRIIENVSWIYKTMTLDIEWLKIKIVKLSYMKLF